MMRRRRVLRRHDCPVPPGLSRLPPLLARLYAHRGVLCAEEVDHSLRNLTPGDAFRGLPRAAELLDEAILRGRSILVVGDYDVDGATSTALMCLGLRAMGAARVDYLVPSRFETGYGLTPEVVAIAQERHAPDVLVTVDNGVSAIRGVRAARAAGMQVIVTDHHLPGFVLPDADALVDPNLPGETFPVKSLAGVGVAFYVLSELRRRLRGRGHFSDQATDGPNLAAWLDLVALGTVADVVPLERDNRILVEQGLRRIRQGACRPGIIALLEVAKRSPARATSADLGYAVAPRLNAAGRLAEMSLGIECLLADDPVRAREIALELDGINRERREIEAGMQVRALDLLDVLMAGLEGRDPPQGLCLFDPDWHQGVIGILASRIRERLHRPVIVFARGGNGEIKGSARSIPGLHIRDVLEEIAARHAGVIGRFGGHAMAAGLSLPEENLALFRECFEGAVGRHLDPADLTGVIRSDGPLGAEEFTVENAALLRDAAPWGQGFDEPLFDGEFRLLERRVVGQDGRHLRLTLCPADAELRLNAIIFNHDPDEWPPERQMFHLAYRLRVDDWKQSPAFQIQVEQVLGASPCALPSAC